MGLLCIFLLLAPVMLLIGIPLFIFCGIYQAKLATALKHYPEDYKRILVGDKPYLYIESILSAGVPQALEEKRKLLRYFRSGDYVGKFSNRQRTVYMRMWYSLYTVVAIFLFSVFAGFLCLAGS